MVAGQQMTPIRQLITCPVRKDVIRFALDDGLPQKIGQIAIPSDLAQADYDADARKSGDLCAKVRGAVADLLWGGLVARGSAADDGGDPGVAKFKTVVDRDGLRLAS